MSWHKGCRMGHVKPEESADTPCPGIYLHPLVDVGLTSGTWGNKLRLQLGSRHGWRIWHPLNGGLG